jgi:hypothetical protein
MLLIDSYVNSHASAVEGRGCTWYVVAAGASSFDIDLRPNNLRNWYTSFVVYSNGNAISIHYLLSWLSYVHCSRHHHLSQSSASTVDEDLSRF